MIDLPQLLEGWDTRPPASPAQLAAFKSATGLTLPDDYLRFLRTTNGAYHPDSGLGFNALEEVVAHTLGYEMAKSRLLHLGSDGGGDQALALDYKWSPPRYVLHELYGGAPTYLGATLAEMVGHLLNKTRPKRPRDGVKSRAPFIEPPAPPRAVRGAKSGLLFELKKHAEGVRGLALAPDGRTAYVGAGNVVRRWDLGTGKLLDTVEMPLLLSPCIGAIDDATVLAAGVAHDPLRFVVGNLADGAVVRELPVTEGGGANAGGCFSPDGRLVFFSWGLQFTAYLEVRTGRPLAALPTHYDGPFAACFARDGGRLLLGAASLVIPPGVVLEGNVFHLQRAGTVFVYDREGHAVGEFQPDGPVDPTDIFRRCAIRFLDVAADGSLLVANPDELRLLPPWDGVTQNPPSRLRLDLRLRQASAARFLGDGRRLAALTRVGTLQIHDAGDGRLLHSFAGRSGENDLLAVSADGTLLATSVQGEKVVRVWHLAD